MVARNSWKWRVGGRFPRMNHRIKLFVVDTGPLITLAAANNRDVPDVRNTAES
jgi:hypothetical protein